MTALATEVLRLVHGKRDLFFFFFFLKNGLLSILNVVHEGNRARELV